MSNAHDFWREAEELGAAILAQMEYYAALGVTSLPVDIPEPYHQVPHPEKYSQKMNDFRPSPGRTAVSSAITSAKPVLPAWAEAQSLSALQAISCDLCAIAQRPQWGCGSENPLVVFIGPDPMIFQDEQGELLYKMIELGLKLKPEQYYVATISKCLIDSGAKPELCLGATLKELELLKPKVVVALGEEAARLLSGCTKEPLGLLRLHTHKVQGLEHIWLRATYSLKDAHASQDVKRELWRDVQKVKQALDRL